MVTYIGVGTTPVTEGTTVCFSPVCKTLLPLSLELNTQASHLCAVSHLLNLS